MTEKEMIKISVEEFSRVQDWMELSEKNSPVYNSLKKRYLDLKAILTSSGVNLTEIDRIKEQGRIYLPLAHSIVRAVPQTVFCAILLQPIQRALIYMVKLINNGTLTTKGA